MIKEIALIIGIAFVTSCSENPTVTFNAGEKDTCVTVKNGRPNDAMSSSIWMSIIDNSINDTIYINRELVVPNRVGELFYLEKCYCNDFAICIKKSKRSSGN